MSDSIRADLDDRQFVAAMPKVELHVHIEGTLEPETLFAIAERNGVQLPYATPGDVADYQANHRSHGKENLVGFLEALDISRGALRTAADYHEMTLAFLTRCRHEGVRYVEMMLDPQQAVRQGVAAGACVEAVTQARRDAAREVGVRSQLIVCFQRDHPPEDALAVLGDLDPHRADIVGIGLDNYETPGFPALFQPVFEAARARDYRLTSHCDVNQPDSVDHIRDCIDLLGVERIDHGLNTVEDPALVESVVERGIALTACPTFYSGMTASPAERLEMHRTLLDAGALISLNTDDPAQFGSGWLTHTVATAMATGPFARAEIVRFMHNAIDSAWADDGIRRALATELDEYCTRSNGGTGTRLT